MREVKTLVGTADDGDPDKDYIRELQSRIADLTVKRSNADRELKAARDALKKAVELLKYKKENE